MPIKHGSELLISFWAFIDATATAAIRALGGLPSTTNVFLLRTIARNMLREIQVLNFLIKSKFLGFFKRSTTS